MEEPKFEEKFLREPFQLPENYFDNFAARMDARLAEEMNAEMSDQTPAKGRHVEFKHVAAWVASIAAVFTGLFVLGIGLMNVQQEVEVQTQELLAQETYDDEMLEMIDVYQIELALAEAEFYGIVE